VFVDVERLDKTNGWDLGYLRGLRNFVLGWSGCCSGCCFDGALAGTGGEQGLMTVFDSEGWTGLGQRLGEIKCKEKAKIASVC
jgi:hypothetical protein